MKLHVKNFCVVFAIALLISACGTNPLTGARVLPGIPNFLLFPMAEAQFQDFLNESTVVTGTPDAQMLDRVGWELVAAAEKWIDANPHIDRIDDYRWEFALVQDNAINAWVLPGGKIVFYTGILPVTRDAAGMATVMGHEIAHAILNHGQQRMTASFIQQGGLTVVEALLRGVVTQETRDLTMTAFGAGSEIFGTLPFSRTHEDEADYLGLMLMAIAGYHPMEAVYFWERLHAIAGPGSIPEWQSTHPSHESRIANLRDWVPRAIEVAAQFGVHFE